MATLAGALLLGIAVPQISGSAASASVVSEQTAAEQESTEPSVGDGTGPTETPGGSAGSEAPQTEGPESESPALGERSEGEASGDGSERSPQIEAEAETPAVAALALPGCDVGAVYGIGAPAAATTSVVMDSLYQVNPVDGTRTRIGAFSLDGGATTRSVDALAADAAGGYLWAVDMADETQLLRYEVLTGITTSYPSGITAAQASVAAAYVPGGALNPTTGIYYYMYLNSGTWTLFAFDTTTNTAIGAVHTFTGATASSQPDLAIDQLGNMFILVSPNNTTTGASLVRFDGPLPTAASATSTTFTAGTKTISTLATNPGQATGIAFSPTGSLVVTTRSTLTTAAVTGRLIEVNPTSGALIGTAITTDRLADLASCAQGSSLRIMKDLPTGRYAASDQFTLVVGGTGVSTTNTGLRGVTTGTEVGLQNQLPAEIAGAVPVTNGQTYTVTETLSANTANYESSWICYDNTGLPDTERGAIIAQSAGAAATTAMRTGSVAIPAGSKATNVLCIFTNTPKSYKITKTASPATAAPGDTVHYTVTMENLTSIPYASGVLADDILTGVLDDANYNNDAAVSSGTVTWTASTTNRLRVTAPLTARGTNGDTVTLTYSVTVPMPLKTAGNKMLTNSVSSALPGSSNFTTNPLVVNTPLAGMGLIKSANPVSGKKLTSGAVVTYTISMQNGGASPEAINFDDVLTDVLDNGDLVAGSITVTPSSVTAVMSGDRLQLRGSLAGGASATVTYKVAIEGPNASPGGDVARNFVVDAGAASPASCDTSSMPCTEHPVIDSLCNVNKVYSIDTKFEVKSYDITTGQIANELPALPPLPGTTFGENYNGFALTSDGQYFIAYRRQSSNLPASQTTNPGVYIRDTQTGALTYIVPSPGNSQLIAGAYSQLNGHYYSGETVAGGTTLTIRDFDLGAQTAGPTQTINFATLGLQSPSTINNGDFAFDSLGNLYVLVHGGNQMQVIMFEQAATAGTGSLDLSKPKVITATRTPPPELNGEMIDGIAFGGDGLLYVGSTDQKVLALDPNTGDLIGLPSGNIHVSVDLASCGAVPHTIELRKNLPNGRHVDSGGPADGDQFGLTLGFSGTPNYSSALTSGIETGVQAQKAGPVPMMLGRQYSFSETAAGTSDLTNYNSSWECVNSGLSGTQSLPLPAGTVTSSGTATGTGTGGTITIPTGVLGPLHIVCTIKNVPKAIVPDPGSIVWQKVDSANTSHLLGGSEWTLTPIDGNGNPGTPIAVTDCVAATAADCGTNSDKDPAAGKFLLEGIPLGNYQLKETKAPAGYQLLSNPISVVVNQSTIPVSVGVGGKIANTQMVVPGIPLTGGMGMFLFIIGAGIIAALVAAGIALQSRRARTRTGQ